MIGERESFWDTLATTLNLIILPSILSFFLVLPSAVLIGLPVTFLLSGTARERPDVYATLGMISGVCVVIGILWWMAALDGWWLTALGMFSGGVTGWTWGQSRAELNELFSVD